MLTEKFLYDKYETMTQELFAEVEVYLVELPEDALRRIAEFFYSMAACESTKDPASREIHMQSADLALEQANCHCHKVLAEEYQRLAQGILDRYGDQVLQKIDGGEFFERIQNKRSELESAIHHANKIYYKTVKEIIEKDSYYADCEPGSARDDELSAKIAESSEVRSAFSSAYEAAHSYYDMLIDDEKRTIHLNEYKAHDERLQHEKRIADIVGNVGFLLGIAGVVVFVFRKMTGM